MLLTKQEFQHTSALAMILSVRIFGAFVILPVFSLYARSLPNSTSFTIGLAIGIYGILQGILHFPLGFWSDRIGRKRVLLIGLFLFSLGSVICAISGRIEGIIIGRSLQGMGAVGSVALAYLTDLIRPKIQAQAMTMIGMFIGFTFLLSLILGPWLVSYYSVSGLFWLTALIAISGIIWVIRLPSAPIQPFPNKWFQSLQSVFSGTSLWLIYVGVLLQHALAASLFYILPQVLNDYHAIIIKDQWHYLSLIFLLSIAPTLIFSTISRSSNKWVYSIAIALMALGAFGVTFYMKHLLFFLISFCLFFMGFNFLEAQFPVLLSQSVPNFLKGTAMGGYSSAQFFGIFIGSMLGSKFEANFGFEAVGSVCFLINFAWFLAWCLAFNTRSLFIKAI